MSCKCDANYKASCTGCAHQAMLCLCVCYRTLLLPEEVEQTLKILVMMPKQLASELASEEQPGPVQNTLDAGRHEHQSHGSAASCCIQLAPQAPAPLSAVLCCCWRSVAGKAV